MTYNLYERRSKIRVHENLFYSAGTYFTPCLLFLDYTAMMKIYSQLYSFLVLGIKFRRRSPIQVLGALKRLKSFSVYLCFILG